MRAKAQLAQAMQQVKAGEAGTDDKDIDLLGLRRRGPASDWLSSGMHFSL